MKKQSQIILSVLGVIALVVITVGVSYAFFTYTKEGATENTISTGTLKFLYDEKTGAGNGIKIADALPMTDAQGKIQTGTNNVFDFTVTGTTQGTASIAYEVNAVKVAGDSDLPDNIVKLYLVEVPGSEMANGEGNETTENGILYSDLTTTGTTGAVGKVLYSSTIPAGTASYQKNFRLRMWIDSTADFSAPSGSTTGEGKYNNKTFSVKVNVYANAQVITVPAGA